MAGVKSRRSALKVRKELLSVETGASVKGGQLFPTFAPKSQVSLDT